MYDKILELMIECVWNDTFIFPSHALIEMEKDLLTTEDVINCVLGGEIIERQKDRLSGEYKYVITGFALDERPIDVVAKLNLIGETYVITVYRVY